MTEYEVQIRRRWQAWLQTPGAGERVVAAINGGDPEEFKRLFRAAIAVDHPSWAKAIERVNAKLLGKAWAL